VVSNPSNGPTTFGLVEAEGIEPSSEKAFQKTSTSLVGFCFSLESQKATKWFKERLVFLRYLSQTKDKYCISTG
jgi:hypothetical protein